jgi:hypothetical protein
MNEVIKEWIAKSEGDFQTAERELLYSLIYLAHFRYRVIILRKRGLK